MGKTLDRIEARAWGDGFSSGLEQGITLGLLRASAEREPTCRLLCSHTGPHDPLQGPHGPQQGPAEPDEGVLGGA